MTDMMAKRCSGLAGGVAVVAFLAALAGLLLPACSSRSKATPAGESAPIPVAVATVAMADIADTFEAGGVVEARTTATIMARILAPVREVRVTPGDRVRAGQVLILLDGSDLSARARSARAAALSADRGATAAASEQQAADAALVLARATHERISSLHARRSATAQELDDVTGALRAAEARAAGAAARAQAAVSDVESARAGSEAAGTTESFARLTAPFDGVVTEKMVEPGNMAAPGTPLMRVEDTRGFRLDVRVDESRLGQIAPGAIVPVSLDSGTGGATASVSGTVAEISRAVEADARAFLVKIALSETAGLRSGTFGRAHFSARVRRALTVPAGALVQRGQMTSVFVVEKGIARVRLVNVNGTEVLAGLSEGDVVIVAAPAAVTDGRRVTEGGR
jgi:multidrug efflux pump subunit AcrA (membrane-fusion protein)